MHFVIQEESMIERGTLYAEVHYWRAKADFDAGKRPVRKNDFVMAGVTATTRQVVRNGRGQYKLASGIFTTVGPIDAEEGVQYETEVVDRDLRGELTRLIVAHWEHAENVGFPADRTTPSIVRSSTDIGGVLARVRTLP